MTIFSYPVILLVDDDPMSANLISRRLGSRKFNVRVADSGQKALAAIAESVPDLVLLDLMMPEMDGYQTLELIRRDHSPSALPVIIATALDNPDQIVRAFETGANDYVTKPFDFPVVMARLGVQISLSRARAATSFANSLLQISLDASSVNEILDKSAAVILDRTGATQCRMVLIKSSDPGNHDRIEGAPELAARVCKGGPMAEAGQCDLPWTGPLAEALRDRRVDDFREIPGFPPIMAEQARLSEGGGSAIIPISDPAENISEIMVSSFGSDHGAWGLVVLSSSKPGRFSESLASSLERCLAQFTLGLGRVMAEETMRRHNENLEALVEARLAELRTVNERLVEENRQRRAAEIKMLNHQILLEHSRAELKKFSGRVLEIREEEKKNLSTALHHEIGSLAVSLSASLSAVADELGSGRVAAALDRLEVCRGRVKDSVGTLKKIALDLRPPDLDIIGLSEALREMVSAMTRDSVESIDFSISGPDDPFPALENLDDRAAITIYRTAQECLCNALKHAGASKIAVTLSSSDRKSGETEETRGTGTANCIDESPGTDTASCNGKTGRYEGVVLEVRDDGRGFDPNITTGEGMGLRAMAEMADAAGGVMTVESAPGSGTIARLRMPRPLSPERLARP